MVFYGAKVTDSNITWIEGSPEVTIQLTNACLTTLGKKRNSRIVLEICDEGAETPGTLSASDSSEDAPLSIALAVLKNNTTENVRLDLFINSKMGLRLAGDTAGAVVDVVGNELEPSSEDEEMAEEDGMEFPANLEDLLNSGQVVLADQDSDEDGGSEDDDDASGSNASGCGCCGTGANGALSEKEKGKVVVRKKSSALPIVTHKSGVKFQDMIIGSGKKVIKGHNVAVYYTLRLENGKVVDKADRKRPFKFRLGIGECVKGFDIGVTGMREGGERHLIIPPRLGYGSQSPPGIPRNSTLFFDVGVVKAF